MERVYSVTINGRTLESRNLRELLTRAVNAKKGLNRGKLLMAHTHARISTESVSVAYVHSGIAVVPVTH